MVLPQPLSPTMPTRSPGSDVEVDLARRLPDAVRGLEADAEPAHRNQRLRAACRNRLRFALCRPGRCHQPAARFFSFTSCSSISISVPMMPSRAELIEFRIGKPEQAAENFLVMFAERRRHAADRKRRFGFAERHRRLRMLADEGAIDLLNEAARMQLPVLQQLDRQPRHAGRDAGRLQHAHRLFRLARRSPGGDRGLDLALDGAPSSRCLQLCVGRPIGAAEQLRKLRPHRIAGNRDHDPIVVAGAGETAMRHEIRMAIAVFHRRLAVDRMRNDPGRGKRHHAFDLREIDELALAGEFRVDQRGEHRGAAVQSADRIAKRRMAHDRRSIGVTDHARQARALLERRAIGAAVAMHAAGAERRHRHHDELWIELAQHLIAKPELRQHFDGVIVDDESASASSRFARLRPCGRVKSSVMPRLLRFMMQ